MLGHSSEGLQIASDDGVSKQASFFPIVPVGHVDDIGFDDYGSGAAIDRAIVQRGYGAIVSEAVIAVHDPKAYDVAVLVQNFEALGAGRGRKPRDDPDVARTAHVTVALHGAVVNETLVPLRAIETAYHGPYRGHGRPNALHHHRAALVARCPHRVVAPHRLMEMMIMLQVLLSFADRPLHHHRLVQSLPRLRFPIPILEAAGKVREYPQLVWLTHAWRPSAVLLQKITDRFDPATSGCKGTNIVNFLLLLYNCACCICSFLNSGDRGCGIDPPPPLPPRFCLSARKFCDGFWMAMGCPPNQKAEETLVLVLDLDLVRILHKYLVLFFTNT
jgi:hypothetical protein